jgi:hypothetical protein
MRGMEVCRELNMALADLADLRGPPRSGALEYP